MQMSNISKEMNGCEAPSVLKALLLQNASDLSRATTNNKHASVFRSQGSQYLSQVSNGKGSSDLPPVIEIEELSNDCNERNECRARFLSKDLPVQHGRPCITHFSKCASESRSQSSPDITPVAKVEKLSNVCNESNGYAPDSRSGSSPDLTTVAKVEELSNVCNESKGHGPDSRSQSSPDLTPVSKVEELSNVCNESNGCVPESKSRSSPDLTPVSKVDKLSNSCNESNGCDVPSSLKALLAHDFPCTTHHSQCEPGIRCRSSTDLPQESRVEEVDDPCIYVCNVCKAYFFSEYQVAQHTYRHGNDSPAAKEFGWTKLPGESFLDRKWLECIFCRKTFTYLHSLKTHLRVHTDEKPFGCDTCGRNFSHKGSLTKHMRLYHEDSALEDALKCPECDEDFFAMSKLKAHLRAQHDAKCPRTCSSCRSVFVSESRLRNHLRECTAHDNRVPCEVCGKKFRSKNTLEVHLYKHRRGKRFQCSVCQRKFMYEYLLREHVSKKHTRERNFECGKCGKTFPYQCSLRDHNKQVHGGR